MCNEREQLIGYIYDECDAMERRRIDVHLGGCSECRDEIAGLRSVRQDLLAWDVPAHDSVWRPFESPRVVPTWREIPAWAMAAAAGLLLLAGGAGGAATYVLMPRPSAAAAVVAEAPRATVVPVNLSESDLSALEARVLATMRAEMSERVRSVPPRASQPATPANVSFDELRTDLQRLRNDQLTWSSATVTEMGQLNSQVAALQKVAYRSAALGQ